MHGSVAACSLCAIRQSSVCGSLTRIELSDLGHMARHKHIRAGRVIVAEGTCPDFFGNIISGIVKLTKTLADGRQLTVGLQFPPDFVGRPYAPQSPHQVQAATDVTLCTFEKTRFERLLKTRPGVEHRLLEHKLDELDAAQEWMLLLARKSAAEKVASFLLMLCRRTGPTLFTTDAIPPMSARFELLLTRADIGDYLGLTLETVSRHMTRLKTQGIIQIGDKQRVLVPDVRRLAEAGAVAEHAICREER
ncbi:MAG: Crp/Fnr family transcriptional regulator [Hyphomicrobiaceae bacterium]